MRLFIAINFEETIQEEIRSVQQRLQGIGRGQLTHRDNLHLTPAFLGEVQPDRLEDVKKAMDDTHTQPLTLCFDHLGRFKRDGGDIVYLGLAHHPALFAMQKELTLHLIGKGFHLERRSYSPHITLARKYTIEQPLDSHSVLPCPITVQAQAISLMHSDRVNGRLTYTELYTAD
jgi:2'-5' RNA ligase